MYTISVHCSWMLSKNTSKQKPSCGYNTGYYSYWYKLGLGDIYFFVYRQTFIAIFDSIPIICFSFTHDCFRADNHRYVPFYKHDNKSQYTFAECVCTSEVVRFCFSLVKPERLLISFPWNF